MKTTLIIIVLLAVFIALPLKMLFATKEKSGIIFSAIEGQLLQNGKPLANTRLERSWSFAEDNLTGSDFTITDANGKFTFPKVAHRYQRAAILAQETFIEQYISLEKGNEAQTIWLGSKRSFADGDETYDYALGEFHGASPIQMVFDVSRPFQKIGSILVRPAEE